MEYRVEGLRSLVVACVGEQKEIFCTSCAANLLPTTYVSSVDTARWPGTTKLYGQLFSLKSDSLLQRGSMVLMGVLDQVQKYVEGILGGLQHRRWTKTI